jgi:hypothetical protein
VISAAVRVERSGQRMPAPVGNNGGMLPESPGPSALVQISDALATSVAAARTSRRRGIRDVGHL